MRFTPEQQKQRTEIDRLLWEGSQEAWVRSIVTYSNLPAAPLVVEDESISRQPRPKVKSRPTGKSK